MEEFNVYIDCMCGMLCLLECIICIAPREVRNRMCAETVFSSIIVLKGRDTQSGQHSDVIRSI